MVGSLFVMGSSTKNVGEVFPNGVMWQNSASEWEGKESMDTATASANEGNIKLSIHNLSLDLDQDPSSSLWSSLDPSSSPHSVLLRPPRVVHVVHVYVLHQETEQEKTKFSCSVSWWRTYTTRGRQRPNFEKNSCLIPTIKVVLNSFVSFHGQFLTDQEREGGEGSSGSLLGERSPKTAPLRGAAERSLASEQGGLRNVRGDRSASAKRVQAGTTPTS